MAFVDRAVAAVGEMSAEELLREWRKIEGARTGEVSPLWLVRLAVTYDRVIKALRLEFKPVPAKVWRRFALAKALDARGMREESDFLTPMYEERISNNKGGMEMPSKNGHKKEKVRVTASSVLIRILGAAKVRADKDIIDEVRQETGSSKFDGKQLAWYKWKYRQGALKGMDGKLHVIEQGSHKKGGKKRIIVKKKAAV